MMAVVAAIEPFWNSLIYKIFLKKKKLIVWCVLLEPFLDKWLGNALGGISNAKFRSDKYSASSVGNVRKNSCEILCNMFQMSLVS